MFTLRVHYYEKKRMASVLQQITDLNALIPFQVIAIQALKNTFLTSGSMQLLKNIRSLKKKRRSSESQMHQLHDNMFQACIIY